MSYPLSRSSVDGEYPGLVLFRSWRANVNGKNPEENDEQKTDARRVRGGNETGVTR